MNTKSIYAGLAGFVTFMVMGYFFYEVLLKSYFAKLLEGTGDCFIKEPPLLPVMIAHICMIIVLLLLMRQNNVTTFMGGIKSTWVIVVLILVWYDSWSFTFFKQMTISTAIVDVCTNGVITLSAAGVMGWVLGKVK